MAGFLFPVCAVNSTLIQILPYTSNEISCYLLGYDGLLNVANEDLRTKNPAYISEQWMWMLTCGADEVLYEYNDFRSHQLFGEKNVQDKNP